MAREYARVHEYYMPLHELQPPSHHYVHYDLQQASESAPPACELTAAGGARAHGHPHTAPRAAHHYARANNTALFSNNYEMPGTESPMAATSTTQHTPSNINRKRKPSSYGSGSTYEDDDQPRSTRSLPDKKQNHSEIEKRRRDKMNTYISELSAIVPMCGAVPRKLDKLTVLRMAVQHLRSVRGSITACPLSARPRPAFLSEKKLNALVLHAAQHCFLLVVGCDRGRLLYVSASVKKMLHYDQSELLGQSLFDILHPKDVAKVKEQLSSSDLSPRERLIDAKTMLPVKTEVASSASQLCPGARRSFFCRIKYKLTPESLAPTIKQEAEPNAKQRKKHCSEKKYCVVQCTGYLKSWAPAEMCEGATLVEGNKEADACNVSCLVGVARALPDLAREPPPTPPTRRLHYVSRHAPDGKFLFVDQRVTLALGFLPQELLGTSLYEYTPGPELGGVARTHKAALLGRVPLHTPPYSFRRKDGSLVTLQTHFKPFKNPWTKDVECLVANNTVIADGQAPVHQDPAHAPFDLFNQTEPGAGDVDTGTDDDGPRAISEVDVEMQRLIESQVESHKIGSAIAEEALRSSSSEFSPDLPADLLQDTVFNEQWLLKANGMCEQSSLVDSLLCAEGSDYEQVRNNVPLSAAGVAGTPPPPPALLPLSGPSPPPSPPLGTDGNGEAAMAVIMSLLEADAGLGGPVNFSGMPWSLP